MESMTLDILGIAETHCVKEGKITNENQKNISKGGHLDEKHYSKINAGLLGYIRERVIMLKLQAKPFNTNIIQVYAPKFVCEDEEVEKLYQEINNGIKQMKSGEVICVMGGFNAKKVEKKTMRR